MTTIREVLDTLPGPERDQLMYAFEHGLAQFVLLPDGRYIGVHARRIPYLEPDPKLTVEPWSVGSIKGKDDENNRLRAQEKSRQGYGR